MKQQDIGTITRLRSDATTRQATKCSTKLATKWTKILTTLLLATCNLHLATAATVVGDLKDISIQALDTKLMFAPTNEVLVTPSGLSAGPPKVIDSTGGQFSLVLEAGDYTVSLPLIPWRHAFAISVFETNGTVNITNFLSPPRTYTFTNYFFRTPLHVNVAKVSAWSTNGESSLLDGTVTLPAGSLTAGKIITIEAFGSFDDPDANAPQVTLKLKLGSVAVVTQTRNAGQASWHASAALTVRTAGTSGTVAGTIALSHDNGAMGLWGFDTQTATVNTTGSLTVDLRASVADFTGEERAVCEQLVIRVE